MTRQKKLRRTMPQHLDFVLCCAFIALVLALFLIPEMRTRAFWAGDKGVLEVLAPVGTVAAASVAAWLTWRNYRLGQQKELSDRFERGVMLLDSDGEAKRTAGIIVLEDLALGEEEGRHISWIREFFPTAINQWNQTIAGTISRPVLATVFEATPAPLLRALNAMSKIRKEDDNALVIPNLYLSQQGLSGITLRDLVSHRAIIYDAFLQRSNFDRMILAGTYFGSFDIMDCSLIGCRMQLQTGSSVDVYIDQSDVSGGYITAVSGTEVALANCKVDGLTLGGGGDFTLENCWYDNTPPIIKSARAIMAGPTVYRAKTPTTKTKAGWPLWNKGPDDDPVDISLIAPNYVLRRAGR